MAVPDGSTASNLLEQIVTNLQLPGGFDKAKVLADLKEYCKLDTWAMVQLLAKLRQLVL